MQITTGQYNIGYNSNPFAVAAVPNFNGRTSVLSTQENLLKSEHA